MDLNPNRERLDRKAGSGKNAAIRGDDSVWRKKLK